MPVSKTQRGEPAASGRGCGTAVFTFNVTWYSRMWSETDRAADPEAKRDGCFKSFIFPPSRRVVLGGDNLRPVGNAVK
jgi:hypothetical protein